MIEKRKGGYVLMSQSGAKKLGGPYRTRGEAVKREHQVQFFKRQPQPKKK